MVGSATVLLANQTIAKGGGVISDRIPVQFAEGEEIGAATDGASVMVCAQMLGGLGVHNLYKLIQQVLDGRGSEL